MKRQKPPLRPERTLTVRAREGVFVPLEGERRQVIGTEPMTVPSTPYYRRQIEHGDLVEVAPTPTKEA